MLGVLLASVGATPFDASTPRPPIEPALLAPGTATAAFVVRGGWNPRLADQISMRSEPSILRLTRRPGKPVPLFTHALACPMPHEQSRTLGDHMVLQAAPQSAVVWGATTPGAVVTVSRSQPQWTFALCHF